jgi:hypothetical protein
VIAAAAGVLAQGSKLENIGAFSDASASEAVRASLDSKGYRVTAANGDVICDLWLRASLPAAEKKDVSGAIYTTIGESALVGVVVFAKPANDFRGQGIKPGAYTLRYALHPSDGNHMGISPYRDFLLLVPVGADQDVNSKFKFEELSKLSARAAGTNHPTPFSLVAADTQKNFPGVCCEVENRGWRGFADRIRSQRRG